MQRVDKTVFISYRRTNSWMALAVYQHLTQHGYDVFLDYTGVGAGAFETAILGNVVSRAHFLVLLTPSALERCQEPGDWLRREIETAIESKRNIIPLMLEGFDFGVPALATQLTGKLAVLKHYQALRIPNDFFEEAMARLQSRYLNLPLSAISHPAPPPALQAAAEQRIAAEAAAPVQEQQLTAQFLCEQGFAATDLDEKIRYYTEAIQMSPDSVAFNNRGVALDNKGDLDGAIADYTEAIRLNPTEVDVFYNRGLARREIGDFDSAIVDYTEAIRLRPDYADAFHHRGVAHQSKGEIVPAIADYTEAIRLNTSYPAAFSNRGILRHNQGDLDGALQDYAEAIRLKPDYAAAYNNRAITRRSKGDLDGAIEDYTEAIRIRPEYAAAFHNRGLARQAKGDAEGAKQDFEQAKRLNPGN